MAGGSQNEQILAWLKAGHTLTPLEALEKFNCWRLGGRIHDLRQTPEGRDIQTEDLTLPNGKRIARYSLPQPKGQLAFPLFRNPEVSDGAYPNH